MRRLLLGALVLVAVAALAWGVHVWRSGRRPPPRPPSPVGAIYKVAENLYVVPGGGGNTAVFVHERGVVLVDTKWAERHQAMIEQVRTVTDKPITHVINTHLHGDHVGGNKFLPADVEVVVHEKTAEYMAHWKSLHGHPLRTFKDRLTLLEGKDAIDLYWFGPAHTGGDAIVVFREARVLHIGDIVENRIPPVINREWGGDAEEFGETLDRTLATIRDVDRVITGHGPVLTWSELGDFAELTHLFVDHARATIASGEDRHEAYLAWRPKLPAKFGSYEFARAEQTLTQVYLCLEE